MRSVTAREEHICGNVSGCREVPDMKPGDSLERDSVSPEQVKTHAYYFKIGHY
jgi:hypothetical protein